MHFPPFSGGVRSAKNAIIKEVVHIMTVTAIEAILLGILQGLTEFLPVSSSGHLVLGQALLGMEGELITFDVFVHVGTLFAVAVVFWQDIVDIFRHLFSRFTLLLIVGCIPAAIMGLLLDDFFTALFGSVTAVACALIVTGILLFISDRFKGQRTLKEMKFRDALVIGVFQGLAITPGLSRSGSTIFGALLCGLKRSEAAKFSFIISIPVILGAALKEGYDLVSESAMVVEWTYFLGAAVAAVCGYLAIRIFLKLLEKAKLRYFSYYVWILAAAVLISRIFA